MIEDIQSRIRELEAMRMGSPTAMELHFHRGGLGRVQRQEDFIFNQRVEEQRQKLLMDLAELEQEEEENGLTMMRQPALFIPALPKRVIIKRRGRSPRW